MLCFINYVVCNMNNVNINIIIKTCLLKIDNVAMVSPCKSNE